MRRLKKPKYYFFPQATIKSQTGLNHTFQLEHLAPKWLRQKKKLAEQETLPYWQFKMTNQRYLVVPLQLEHVGSRWLRSRVASGLLAVGDLGPELVVKVDDGSLAIIIDATGTWISASWPDALTKNKEPFETLLPRLSKINLRHVTDVSALT